MDSHEYSQIQFVEITIMWSDIKTVTVGKLYISIYVSLNNWIIVLHVCKVTGDVVVYTQAYGVTVFNKEYIKQNYGYVT